MDEFRELRNFKEGDSLQAVSWKQVAQGQGLFIKVFEQHQDQHSLEIHYAHMPSPSHEEKLSLMMGLVEQCEQLQYAYALYLPHTEVAKGIGREQYLKPNYFWLRHSKNSMHSSIRIAIVLTLSLIWITQLSFSPVLLSVIFAICIGCLWYFMKSTGNYFPKWAIYILTLVALAVTFWSYQSFLGVEAGVAVLSIFLFAKALETKTQRDAIILFNFALFVAASMFLHSQSFMTAVMVLLCLLSCLLGLYRVQTHAFASEKSNRMALRQDAKHVIKFVGLALPFFVLLFIFFPRLPPLWHIPIPENKAVTGMSDSMSPGDIAQLSQSSHLAFRIIGDVTQLPNRSELYWRAMVLDQYDGQKWTSSFINQQGISDDTLTHISTSKKWNYQYLPADVAIPWIMALEYSQPLERRYRYVRIRVFRLIVKCSGWNLLHCNRWEMFNLPKVNYLKYNEA